MHAFGFTVLSTDKKTRARRGIIRTPHGEIATPAFVPVGTQATVKTLTPDELAGLDVHLFFVNTYHMYLRPGMDVIQKFGGLHTFMNWNKPLITDSGGFQVYSLARQKFPSKDRSEETPALVRIDEDGVQFRSHWDGTPHTFTPEVSMELQWQLGADIHIAFDDCTPYPVTRAKAEKSLARTHRWAKRSLAQHQKLVKEAIKHNAPYQALYGSIQGSTFEDLRVESARFLSSMEFDGLAIGGVSVGESKKEMIDVLRWVTPILPGNKPRHLLGVGEIDDIFALIECGMDTFDCVQPTRLARMGHVYTSDTAAKEYLLDINKRPMALDAKPLDSACGCYTCTHFSRAYIHHLFHVRELLGYRLTTIHNIFFVQQLVARIRRAIEEGSFLELKKQWLYNRYGGHR